jgi:hypothetical protein
MADEPSDGSEKDRNAPTVRDLKTPTTSTDTIPDIVGQYVPPRPLPEATAHRTIDLRPVRLSAELDPRQALTERRLVSPPRRQRGLSAWWLGGGLGVAVGIGAWLFASKPPASTASAAATVPAREATASVPPAAPAPPDGRSLVRSLAPFGSASTILPSKAPPTTDAPAAQAASAALPTAPRAPSARDASKKRKDPWLE